MNTIKIILAESGSIADIMKDFPLYQGAYQNKLLNVLVPKSILAPYIDSQLIGIGGVETNSTILTFSTTIGMTFLERNGAIDKSKSYNVRYLKDLIYNNVEYSLFERMLPQAFTIFAGEGENAPKLIININNIKKDATTGVSKVISLITSQTCSLNVLESSILDEDPPIEPTEVNLINGDINDLYIKYNKNTVDINALQNTKQDKVDNTLSTTSKSVVGAINELLLNKQDKTDNTLATLSKSVVGAINEVNSNSNTNATNIETISADLAYLKAYISTGEVFIGMMTVNVLPTISELNDFVFQTTGRTTINGDTIIVVLDIPDKTNRNYKYIYGAGKWSSYELPAMEKSSNGTYGIIEGTYGTGKTYSTLVDIVDGDISKIYTKDETSNTMVDINSFINTNKNNIAANKNNLLDIENGIIPAGNSLKMNGKTENQLDVKNSSLVNGNVEDQL
ncbi:MAG: hypothetical protein RR334_03740, partial [Clostridia bacterium]